ncbi:MAG: ChuX/HutX family heme-like substrate-binding protein [Rhodospirillaceae bacterium]
MILRFPYLTKVLGIGIVALSPGTANTASHQEMCATSTQKVSVEEYYVASAGAMTFRASDELGVTEAVVLSALGEESATGTTGISFNEVWESLRSWTDAMTVIRFGGQVFEVHGPVNAGAPSTRSNFFNLSGHNGVGGHLRPDLISSIYAISLASERATIRGVTFLDQSGNSIFGVYVPSEGEEPPQEIVEQFKATKKLIASLPSAC